MAALLLGAAPVSAATPFSTFTEAPSIQDLAISPDGALLAVTGASGGQRTVVVESATDSKPIMTVRLGAKDVLDVRWAGNEHVLIELSTNAKLAPDAAAYDYPTVIAIDVQSRVQQTLLSDATSAANVVLGKPQVRMIGGKPFAFVGGVQRLGDAAAMSLFSIDLETQRSRLVVSAKSEHTDRWLVDQSGAAVAQTEFDDKAGRWDLLIARGGDWRVAKTVQANIEHPYLFGFGAGGHTLLLSGAETAGDEGMHEMAFDGSDWGPAFAESSDYITMDPNTDEMVATRETVDERFKYSFLSPADQANWSAVSRVFPGENLRLVSMSADRRKMVVSADSPTLGPAFSLVDLNAKTARWIGPAYNALGSDDISPVEPIRFKASDGLDITGYLTLPRGKALKQLPTIVFSHGWPSSRVEPGFDWWAQAMASRGYAVLQVNYRGTEGFGWKFVSAGFGEWGRKMQTDLSDGVRFLATQGRIDPKRVCIVGDGYGGYAAMAGAAFDPGVYRCAVDVAGPVDMKAFTAWAQSRDDNAVGRYLRRYMGVDGQRDHRLDDISPADHADKITIPVLIIHGKDDTVTPFEQSQRMAAALTKAGKSVQLVVLNHEDSWLSHSDTRLQMLQATMDFVQKNNPAD